MPMAEQTKKILMALLLGVIAFGVMIIFFTLQQSLMVATIVLMVTLWTNEGLPLAVVSLYSIEWGYLTAGINIALIPILVLMLIFQKQMVRGLTLGAIRH